MMDRITLEQIEELPDRERLQLWQWTQHVLTSALRRKKAEARNRIEAGCEEQGEDYAINPDSDN